MVARVVVEGTGGKGSAPYANVWHFAAIPSFGSADAQAVADALRTFYNSLAAQFPTGVTWAINGYGVTTLDDSSGHPTARYAPTFTPVLCSGGATTAPLQVASMVKWLTGLPGRGASGRTYLGPLASGVVVDGTINSASVTSHQTAANALIAAAGANTQRNLVVYHRPVPAGQPHGPRIGSQTPVIGALVDAKTETQRRRV